MILVGERSADSSEEIMSYLNEKGVKFLGGFYIKESNVNVLSKQDGDDAFLVYKDVIEQVEDIALYNVKQKVGQ